jgi:hypothetical protein
MGSGRLNFSFPFSRWATYFGMKKVLAKLEAIRDLPFFRMDEVLETVVK